MEFLLDFYNYYMVCVLFSHTYHMTHHVTSHCDFLSCDHDTCDTCDMTLSHTLSYIVSPKEKKKKRNINNNLAVLPSYDTLCNLATSTRYSVFSLFQVIDHKDPSSSLLLEIGYYDLAKQLSHYLYLLYFTLLFLLDLLHRKECRKVSCHKCHIVMVTWQKVTVSYHMTSYDGSHDNCGKVVHRPYSSCISSIENLTGTPLSSFCQLRLGGWFSHLG